MRYICGGIAGGKNFNSKYSTVKGKLLSYRNNISSLNGVLIVQNLHE